MKALQIGTSGRGIPNDRLPRYFRQFNSIEITAEEAGSTGRLAAIVESLPPGGSISVAAPPGLLFGGEPADADGPLARLVEQVAPLDDRLGALLFAVPADFPYSPTRLAAYLDRLPAGRRHVLQFHGTAWYKERLRALLEEREIALCQHDERGRLAPEWVTAGFLYLRHTAESYTSDEIQRLAARLDAHLARGRTVHAYFAGAKPEAAADCAAQLLARLDQP